MSFYGNLVYLKVSPTKGVKRFNKKGKLSPRYFCSYMILGSLSHVAYELALPADLEIILSSFSYEFVKEVY